MHEQFGRYILLERIAIGGMAEIFKAKAPGLGGFEKILAIKRLHPRYSQDADFIEMLIDEARISVELSHSNVGQIFDLGKVEDHYFIAMEFIDGRDLYRVMKRLKDRRTQFPIDGAAYVAAEASGGLDYAHRKKDARGRPLNIIHRDVSPQNVLVSYEGEAKIVDFGIAKAALRAYETESGIIKGKFYYMSPEQARGEPLDHRTDIFSLGIVLYEMLTGDLLYKDDDDVTLLSRVRKAEIQPPSMLRPDIPRALERIVMKALARDREERYPSALHLQKDLNKFLRSSGSTFSKTRLARMMRELFLDEAPGDESEELDAMLLRNRSELPQDKLSVISHVETDDAFPLLEPTRNLPDDEEETSVEPPGTDALATGMRSEMFELDPDDLEPVEESVRAPAPAVVVRLPAPRAVEPVEVRGPPADLDDDPFFEEESTRALPPKRNGGGQSRAPDPLAFAAAPTPVPDRPAPRQDPDWPPPGRDEGGPRVDGRSAVAFGPGRGERGARGAAPQNGNGAATADGFNRRPTVIVPADSPIPAPPNPRAAAKRRPTDQGPSSASLPAAPPIITRERLIFGGLIALVIVVAAVVTNLVLRREPLPPVPTEPATVTVGVPAPPSGLAGSGNATLVIRSFPSGAKVKVNGAWLPEGTPTRSIVPAGKPAKVQIRLSEEYEPYEVEVSPQPGQELPVEAQLAKIRGILTVESSPSGALVLVNGSELGRTPLTQSDLAADRPLKLRVVKDGFEPYEQTVDWDGRREKSIDVRLEPVAADPAPLPGGDLGRAPTVIPRAPEVRVAAREPAPIRRPPPRRVVREPAREPEPVRQAPAAARRPAPDADRAQGVGYVSVQSKRWGAVFLDGSLVAPETPLIRYKLTAGDHTLQIAFGGDKSNKSPPRRVTVPRGDTLLVKF